MQQVTREEMQRQLAAPMEANQQAYMAMMQMLQRKWDTEAKLSTTVTQQPAPSQQPSGVELVQAQVDLLKAQAVAKEQATGPPVPPPPPRQTPVMSL